MRKLSIFWWVGTGLLVPVLPLFSQTTVVEYPGPDWSFVQNTFDNASSTESHVPVPLRHAARVLPSSAREPRLWGLPEAPILWLSRVHKSIATITLLPTALHSKQTSITGLWSVRSRR